MLNVTEAATKKLTELLSQQEGVLGLRMLAIECIDFGTARGVVA